MLLSVKISFGTYLALQSELRNKPDSENPNQDSYNAGYSNGIEAGKLISGTFDARIRTEGHNAGFKLGHEQGYNKGYTEGKQSLKQMISNL